VGDSPQPGCGYYADNAIGGVAFSGDGEHIARKMLAARVMHSFDRMNPDLSLQQALAHVEEIGGEAGGIALSWEGMVGWAHNSRDFPVAYASSDIDDMRAFIRKDQERS
jgi:beta-aspartyl-peptidase (threonine type)